MGGFKEGVGGAEKPCRCCNISKNDLSKYDCHEKCSPRSMEEHKRHIQALEVSSTNDRQLLSQRIGVNGRTFLSDVPFFDVTKCILQDPMHILLEGIVKVELKLILLHLMEQNVTSLVSLNRSIANFEYSNSERNDRPQRFERKHLQRGVNLPQTAANILVLLRVLPFIVGPAVTDDDQYWNNFIRLVKIVQLSL